MHLLLGSTRQEDGDDEEGGIDDTHHVISFSSDAISICGHTY